MLMNFSRIPNLVSIVVPVFNNVQYLEDCLSSLIGQTYKDIEIILVDDHSTEDIATFVDHWQEDVASVLGPNRLLYFRLPRNTKQPGSATTGLFLAQGEFIACQAADDVSHPERLEKELQFLGEHPEVDMVGTCFASFKDGDIEHATPASWLAYGRENISKSYSLGRHCICDGTVMMRGAAFDRLGGWTRRMKSVSDFEFIARYISNGVIAENLPTVLYYYRLHADQTTNRLIRGEDW